MRTGGDTKRADRDATRIFRRADEAEYAYWTAGRNGDRRARSEEGTPKRTNEQPKTSATPLRTARSAKRARDADAEGWGVWGRPGQAAAALMPGTKPNAGTRLVKRGTARERRVFDVPEARQRSALGREARREDKGRKEDPGSVPICF